MQSDPKTWMRQADLDMEMARAGAAIGRFEWACFCCQQAAEKALKAVLYGQGRSTEVHTHSVGDLVRACRRVDASFRPLVRLATELDRYYLPTRYPDASNGSAAPGDLYEAADFERANQCAESILTACRNWLGGSSDS